MALDRRTLSGTVAANAARLPLRVNNRRAWTIKQITVDALGVGATATCGLYIQRELIAPVAAQRDVIDGEPPVTLRPGELLEMVWGSATNGVLVKATIIYDDGS